MSNFVLLSFAVVERDLPFPTTNSAWFITLFYMNRGRSNETSLPVNASMFLRLSNWLFCYFYIGLNNIKGFKKSDLRRLSSIATRSFRAFCWLKLNPPREFREFLDVLDDLELWDSSF